MPLPNDSKHKWDDVIYTKTQSRQKKRRRNRRCTIQITIKVQLYIPQIYLSCILLRGYKYVCFVKGLSVVPFLSSFQIQKNGGGGKRRFLTFEMTCLGIAIQKGVKCHYYFNPLKKSNKPSSS